jgi:hypothetical protein
MPARRAREKEVEAAAPSRGGDAEKLLRAACQDTGRAREGATAEDSNGNSDPESNSRRGGGGAASSSEDSTREGGAEVGAACDSACEKSWGIEPAERTRCYTGTKTCGGGSGRCAAEADPGEDTG